MSNLNGQRPVEGSNPSKEPKKKIFAEIPRYLMKVSSTLFKKATAAEIFMSKLDLKKKQIESGSNKVGQAKNIIKVGQDDGDGNSGRRDHVVNMMTDPSSIITSKSRRKSVEVLMKGANQGSPLERPSGSGNNEEIPKKEKPIPSRIDQLSKHKKNAVNQVYLQNIESTPRDFNLDHSFKSE